MSTEPVATLLSRRCPTCGAFYPHDEVHRCANEKNDTVATPSHGAVTVDGPPPSELAALNPTLPRQAQAASKAEGDLVGLILGERYAIEQRLSAGGMGVVYRARHTVLDSPVAVKILRKAQDTEAQRRFLQEAKLASLIRHPNTVYISDFGVLADGRSYIVMEFLSGPTLGRVLVDSGGRLPVGRATRIALQIAQGLEAVHAKGIVHRDLKPENIFVLRSEGTGEGKEYVKIVDFGIAVAAQQTAIIPQSPSLAAAAAEKTQPAPSENSLPPDLSGRFTEAGTILGTPHYMSPEQADESTVDARSDQYALGCIFYELLTGTVPFDHPKNPTAILIQHVGAPVEPPQKRCPAAEIPDGVSAIVLRMLAKKREDRYPSMAELAAALSREIATLAPDENAPAIGGPGAAGPASGQSRLSTQVVLRPRRWQLLAMGSAVGLLVAASGYLGFRQWQAGRRDRPRTVAADTIRDLRQRSTALLGEQLRAGERELRLGALAALSRTQDVEARGLIEPLLQAADSDPMVQAQAATALAQLGDRQSVPALTAALDKAKSAAARAAIADALDQLDDERGQRVLLEMLDGQDDEARFRAAYFLCRKGNRKAVAVLSGLLERARPPEDILLDAYARLAQAGEASAKQQIVSRLNAAGSSARQLPLAFRLAQLGDERALKLLRDLAEHVGPEQLLAARLLAAVEHPNVVALFRRVLNDPQATPAALGTAMEGLGLAGELPDILILRPRLDPPKTAPSEPLRQQAAAAVLQLVASDPSVMSDHSLHWARSAITDSNWTVRESAAALLGDLPNDQAGQLLGQMLKDGDARVRRRAVRSLGKRPNRSTLLSLREALYDGDGAVRTEALKAMLRVGKTLSDRGEKGLAGEILGWFKDVLSTGSPTEQVLARSVLRKLGDASQDAALLAFRSAPDQDVRRLLIENHDGDRGVLVSALSDSELAVRWQAARRLAEVGDARSIPALRETLKGGGPQAVAAFGLLRRLGQAAEPPPDIEKGLGAPNVADRLLTVESLGKLPAELAVPLLTEAARDPERLVRRLVAEVAADFPETPEGPPGLPGLRMLQHDPDPGVRFRVQALIARYGDLSRFAIARKPEPSLSQSTPRRAPAPEEPPPPPSPPDAGTGPADMTPVVPPPAVLENTPPPPSSAGEAQFLAIQKTAHAGLAAFERKDYSKALRLLAKAATDCEKKRKLAQSCAGLSSEMYVRLGEIYEKQDQIVEAAGEFQSALHVDPDHRARPEVRTAAEQGLIRLGRQLGRLVVPKTDHNGKCREVTQWVLPGSAIVSKDGQSQLVKVRPGEIRNLGGCP